MAKISFRQGIVSHPKNSTTGKQTFLRKNGNNVDIVIDTNTSAEPIIIAFSHQETDYLYTESKSQNSAWDNCPAGQDYWLYWELDLNTGELIRGKTTREPVYSANDPGTAFRVVDQMWYDTDDSVFKVWQGSVWREVVRVMAAKLSNGTTFQSLSANAGNDDFEGTQVGAYLGQRLSRRVGSLVFNKAGKAIKNGNKRHFFTTEDKFLTGVPTGASLRINNNVIVGTAQCPIAAYQIVQYNEYNKICLANAFEQGDKLFGIVESDIETQEIASFVTEGIVFNEAWDWELAGIAVNSPVYIDNVTKFLTPVKPITDKPPVGVIIGKKEIYFAPRLFPQISVTVGSGGGLTPAQLIQLNDVTQATDINTADIASLDTQVDGLVIRVNDVEADIIQLQNNSTAALPLSGGTLTGPLLLPVGVPSNDQNATTKLYVDTLVNGFQLPITVGQWVTTNPENTLTILQVTHGRRIGVYYDVIVADANGRRLSVDYGVDLLTGNVTLYTLGEPFAGTVRII